MIVIHSSVDTLNSKVWKEVESQPVSESYKKLQQEKRRVLIEENESDDTEVIFMDEHTRPEDIMEGKDLEDYYRSQRTLYSHDSSSTDKEQRKMVKEMARILNVDPYDLPGYKTLFENNQSIEAGIPESVQHSFDYFEELMNKHPELHQDFEKWQRMLDHLASIDVSKLSNSEFKRLSSCPQSILNVVDETHRSLFIVNREDFKDYEQPHPIKESSSNSTVASFFQVFIYRIKERKNH